MRPALPFLLLLASLALARAITGCAALPALTAALPAAAEGIAALVKAELDKAKIPPDDPAYVAAMAGARAIEAEVKAELADAGAQTQAKLDALLVLARAQARKPPHGSVPRANADAGTGVVVLGDGGP